MRILVTTIALLASLAPALAGDAGTSREEARVRAQLRKGQQQLVRQDKAKTDGRRLKALERARLSLLRARKLARKSKDPQVRKLEKLVNEELVLTLTLQAKIYYDRRSLPRAGKRVHEALKIDPHDGLALALAKAVKKAGETGLYDQVKGIVAARRIGDRRAESGAPLRERGVARPR